MAQRAVTSANSEAMRVSVVLFFLLAASDAQGINEKCVTPNSLMGDCIAVESCPYVLSMLTTSLSQSQIDNLRSFQCGFQGSKPYVCCPQELKTTTEASDIDGHPNSLLLPTNTCGNSFVSAIYTGSTAQLYEFPWMALIGYRDESGLKYRCGGTIINEWYILTAAHCITQLPDGIQLSTVRIGEHDLKSNKDCQTLDDLKECPPSAQDYGIKEIISHPQFDKKAIKNDIGLIRLDRPVNFSVENTRPICLPLDQKPIDLAESFRIAGWGITMEGVSSSTMKTTGIKPLSTETCANAYKKLVNISESTQICMDPEYSRSKLCVADSGGPLMRSTITRVQQIGVMSFASESCRSDKFPRVYTKVVPYLRWILDSIKP